MLRRSARQAASSPAHSRQEQDSPRARHAASPTKGAYDVGLSMAQSGGGASTAELLARATPLRKLQLRCKGGFAGPDDVGVKSVEAQAHRAIGDDCFLCVFARLGIQRDDERLSLRLWHPASKPIFDLPKAMSTSTRSATK